MLKAREARALQGIRSYDYQDLIKSLEHYIKLAVSQGDREMWFNATQYGRFDIDDAAYYLKQAGYRVVIDPIDARLDKLAHKVIGSGKTLQDYILVEW